MNDFVCHMTCNQSDQNYRRKMQNMYRNKLPILCPECLCRVGLNCHKNCLNRPKCNGSCHMVVAHVRFYFYNRTKNIYSFVYGFMFVCNACNSKHQCDKFDPEPCFIPISSRYTFHTRKQIREYRFSH